MPLGPNLDHSGLETSYQAGASEGPRNQAGTGQALCPGKQLRVHRPPIGIPMKTLPKWQWITDGSGSGEPSALQLGDFISHGDMWQCPETFLSQLEARQLLAFSGWRDLRLGCFRL